MTRIAKDTPYGSHLSVASNLIPLDTMLLFGTIPAEVAFESPKVADGLVSDGTCNLAIYSSGSVRLAFWDIERSLHTDLVDKFRAWLSAKRKLSMTSRNSPVR